MKACYKRIKSVMRPTAVVTTDSKSGIKHASVEGSLTSSKAAGQLRHAKCLGSRGHYGMRETCHPNVLRRSRRTFSPDTVTIPPGSLTLAQIRSVPLNVRQIRGIPTQQEDRSSYVVNAEQIRSRVPPPLHQLKRSRSLSPQILRTTATTQLKSPTLVRSVSNVGGSRKESNGRKILNPTSGSYTLRRSSLLRHHQVQRERSTGSPKLHKINTTHPTTTRSLIPVVKSPLALRRSDAGTAILRCNSPTALLHLRKRLERDGSTRGMSRKRVRILKKKK